MKNNTPGNPGLARFYLQVQVLYRFSGSGVHIWHLGLQIEDIHLLMSQLTLWYPRWSSPPLFASLSPRWQCSRTLISSTWTILSDIHLYRPSLINISLIFMALALSYLICTTQKFTIHAHACLKSLRGACSCESSYSWSTLLAEIDVPSGDVNVSEQ
jgi:hypothetical protein